MRLVLLLLFGIALPTYGRTFEAQIQQASPQAGNFSEYRLWLSPDAHPNRILVVVWGASQCSLGIVDDPAWQQLAGSMKCALLAVFSYPQASDNHWDRANEGSGKALLEAIHALAQTSGENQLADASLYLVGDSQGGQFAFSFASWQPTRTLGFVSLKGGHHDVAAIQGASGVPGLFFAGELDAPFRIANIKEIFSEGRARGAPWCLAVDPHGDHSPDPCGPLVRSYLQALSRAPLDQRGGKQIQPAKPDLSLSTEEISARPWFPDAVFKRDWLAFESGSLRGSSPPLNFESVMPPALGKTTPPSENLGIIESGQKSQQFCLAVSPDGDTKWDSVSVLDCPFLSDTRIVKISPNRFAIYADLSTSDLPLGRFTSVMPLRFKSRGNSILGGLNVSLTATVTGDVTAIPPLILLKSRPDGINSVHLQITSKKKQPITLLTYQAVSGVKLESSSTATEPLELTVSFDAFKASPSGFASGSLLLRLKTDKEWVLRVPYMTSD